MGVPPLDRPAFRRAAACGTSPGRLPKASWRRQVDEALVLVRELSENRRVRELYGETNFDRVLNDLTSHFNIFGGPNASSRREVHMAKKPADWKLRAPAHVCLAASILKAHCAELNGVLTAS